MGCVGWEGASDEVSGRPGGLPLVVVLPESARVKSVTQVLRAIERTRPQVVLPFHETVDPIEVSLVLRRPPPSLPASVSEYLAWRGLRTDQATARVIGRIVELSENVQTITALARSLYMSRRALGRRFMTRTLPVPSHWLHMSRLLRATIRLQNSESSLFSVACELGYPDGFSLSNQMSRLCGVRPSEVRERLGWEWVLEAWLMRERDAGGLVCRGMGGRSSLLAAPARTPELNPAADSPSVAVSL
ncbi:MAG: helix-turn-helix domain-containing protein [Longimicrobiales bacterium]